MDSKELIKGNTPTLILSVLSSRSLHGYGIARAIEELSDHSLSLREGTLYPMLHAMERDGLVEGAWTDGAKGRRSRIYQITAVGLAELASRQDQWRTFSLAINRVLAGGRNA